MTLEPGRDPIDTNNFTTVEFFCGHGNISSSLKEQGFQTWKTDIRYRKGKCTPDYNCDILNLKRSDIPFDKIDVAWASIPCDVFSHASGDYYLTDYGKLGENALHFIKLLKKTVALFEEMQPALWFIENPKGRMRYQKTMVDFLARNNGTIKECTLSSYGFPTTKPTDIFTNAYSWQPLPMDKFGRGAKCMPVFNKMTKCQRQETPWNLCKSISMFCREKLTSPFQNLPGPFFNGKLTKTNYPGHLTRSLEILPGT